MQLGPILLQIVLQAFANVKTYLWIWRVPYPYFHSLAKSWNSVPCVNVSFNNSSQPLEVVLFKALTELLGCLGSLTFDSGSHQKQTNNSNVLPSMLYCLSTLKECSISLDKSFTIDIIRTAGLPFNSGRVQNVSNWQLRFAFSGKLSWMIYMH